MKKWKIILSIVLALLVIPVAAGAIYLNFILDQVTVSEGEVTEQYKEEFEVEIEEDFDLKINTELESSEVKNIALFGVDCRTADYNGCRSDVMMVLSYDKDMNNVIVTSLVRDTYVEIENRGFDKMNHAYAFGGPKLAIQTINKNFDLDIESYITVDFWTVEKIIDAVGGVEIDVSSEELPYVNSYLTELNNKSPEGTYVNKLTSSGKQLLNGRQAVAYMRIRYVGDGDFERMQRQREVMGVALEGVKSISLTNMLSLVNNLLSDVRTNLSKSEIISLVTNVATKGIPTMQQSQIPTRDGGIGKKINGIYYFVPNTLLENVTYLHELIYPDIDYSPSQTVIGLSSELEKY